MYNILNDTVMYLLCASALARTLRRYGPFLHVTRIVVCVLDAQISCAKTDEPIEMSLAADYTKDRFNIFY